MSESPQIQKAKKIEKPWGYELIWAHENSYVGKILFIRAGESLSLQYHQEKEETIFVQKGTLLFETGKDKNHLEKLELLPGDTFHIVPGCIHRMSAKEDCTVLEVSTPQLEDVVRLEDRYGRC